MCKTLALAGALVEGLHLIQSSLCGEKAKHRKESVRASFSAAAEQTGRRPAATHRLGLSTGQRVVVRAVLTVPLGL